MEKRVADIVMDTLLEHNIDTCFGVVGGGAMFLDNALLKCEKMKKIFNHHEQASAMAAEAYARYSGKMAAVCVTSGPGATNTLTGVMGAWQDSLPMIVISGQVRYEISVPKSGLKLRYRGIQEFQIVPTVKNMTKYAVMITDPKTIKREIVKAINIAMDGRRGPVWIDIPQDIQNAKISEEELLEEKEFVSEINEVREEDIKYIIENVNKSKRPCILAGSGIISSGARELFEGVVEKLKMPVIGGAWVADNFYQDHRLFFGNSGNVGPRVGNFILQNADLIITFGNSLGFRQTGFFQEEFAKHAKIIMVDADENEGKKPGLNIDKVIKADLKDIFSKITDIKIDDIIVDKKWISYCNRLKLRFLRYESAENAKEDERVSAGYFWKKFEEFEKHDSILSLGNNTACTVKLQYGVMKKEQRVMTNYTCGSMGYDIPAAIGAGIASGGKQITCVTGDGGIMMNIQELQTIVKNNINVNIVIFSNNGYGAIRQTCKNFFKGDYIGCTPDTGIDFPDFKDIANTFGFKYKLCEKNKDVEECIKWLINSKDRVILEVNQKLDDPIIPKVMSRLDENGIMKTPALQDMYPFIEKAEYEKLMISTGKELENDKY